MSKRTPLLSVVTAIQEHDCFASWIAALARQEGVRRDQFEVVAVDGSGIRDWSVEAAREAAVAGDDFRFRFRNLEPCGRAAAHNRALALAEGDLILFLADDFVPEAGVVAAHLEFHREQREAHRCALGPGIFPSSIADDFTRWLEESGDLFGLSFIDPGLVLPPDFWYVGNTSLKRSFLDRVGRFDERFPYDAWDDFEMGQRLFAAGLEVEFLPGAICYHQHRVSLKERGRAMRRAGVSARLFEQRHLGVQPWDDLVERLHDFDSLTGRCLTRLARVRLPLSMTRGRKARCYRRILDAEFLEGYVKGMAKED